MTKVKIPYRKLYLIQAALGKLVLVMMGACIIAVLFQSVALFGLLTVFISIIWWIKEDATGYLFGRKVALVVSEKGLIDYTYPYKVGLIPWEEISAVEERNILFQKRVCIQLYEPSALVEKEERFWNMWRMQWSIFVHQTPYIWENRRIAMPQKDFLRLLQEVKAGTYDFNNLGQHLIEQ